MIYAILMAAGIMEALFAGLLIMEFFDMDAEKEAEYQDGYEEGFKDGLSYKLSKKESIIIPDDFYYDALVNEANYWFGMDGDM